MLNCPQRVRSRYNAGWAACCCRWMLALLMRKRGPSRDEGEHIQSAFWSLARSGTARTLDSVLKQPMRIPARTTIRHTHRLFGSTLSLISLRERPALVIFIPEVA